MENVIPTPKSNFIKIRCNKCKNEQIIFDKAATKTIVCLVCGEEVAKSSGGKTIITAKILETLG